jgi:hypothetical protein
MRAHALACFTLIALGTAHGLGTLYDAVVSPTFFRPVDAGALDLMQRSPLRLGDLLGGKHMTAWRGHVGWNLSISLVFVTLGALRLRLARREPSALASRALWTVHVAACAGFAAIAALAWFWAPFAGFLLATASLMTALPRGEAVAPPPAGPSPRARWLVAGAVVLGLAGASHGLLAIADVFGPAMFSPVDPRTRAAMEASELALPAMLGSSRATWTAYLGFHFAHGLGVTAVATSAIVLARRHPDAIARDRGVSVLFAVSSLTWLAIAIACWFWAVWAVTAIASVCHLRAVWTPAPTAGRA